MDTIQIRKQVGNNLKQIRKSFGESERKLASAINVSHSTINKYENGKCDMPLSKAVKICKHYNIKLDELIAGSLEEYVEASNDVIHNELELNKWYKEYILKDRIKKKITKTNDINIPKEVLDRIIATSISIFDNMSQRDKETFAPELLNGLLEIIKNKE